MALSEESLLRSHAMTSHPFSFIPEATSSLSEMALRPAAIYLAADLDLAVDLSPMSEMI